MPLIIGCGGSKGPPTQAVTGVVTVAGQPVEGATIQFLPAADEGAAGGHATSAADGTFEAESTFDAGKTMQKGLLPGDYRVTVAKLEMPAGPPSLKNPPKNVLPPAYQTAETTTLQVTVKPGEANHFELKL